MTKLSMMTQTFGRAADAQVVLSSGEPELELVEGVEPVERLFDLGEEFLAGRVQRTRAPLEDLKGEQWMGRLRESPQREVDEGS